MYKTNAKIGGMVQYFDIAQYQTDRGLRWIAWYYMPLESIEDLTNEGEE